MVLPRPPEVQEEVHDLRGKGPHAYAYGASWRLQVQRAGGGGGRGGGAHVDEDVAMQVDVLRERRRAVHPALWA